MCHGKEVRQRSAIVLLLLAFVLGACSSASDDSIERLEFAPDEKLVLAESASDVRVPPEVLDALEDVRQPLPASIVAAYDSMYDRCAKNLDFDPGGVQVIRDGNDIPQFVKTGRNVPAEVHSVCWELIGGDANGRSSWNEDGLLDPDDLGVELRSN